MVTTSEKKPSGWFYVLMLALFLGVAVFAIGYNFSRLFGPSATIKPGLQYQPRLALDTSGYAAVTEAIPAWEGVASLGEISRIWQKAGQRMIDKIDRETAASKGLDDKKILSIVTKATLYNYEGEATRAYDVLEKLRNQVAIDDEMAGKWLFTIIYVQGVCSLRRGENENCIMCRGESSCIIPIAPSAVHTNPIGSRQAIRHFTEYLEHFPGDLEVRYLLNLAHMTLGEYPQKVESSFLVRLDQFENSEFDIGAFRDIGHLAGVNRLNQAGGAVMEDFHNTGLLDIVISSFDPDRKSVV